MTAKKTKIQAYIKRDIFERFEADQIAWGLSHLQAIERSLAERYEHNSNACDRRHVVSKVKAQLRITNYELPIILSDQQPHGI